MVDRIFTCNINDNTGMVVGQALACGYNAYHANGVTAVEVRARDQNQAYNIVKDFGLVYYIYE